MCTAITYYPNKHYFGRNLDIDYSYNESVVIVPRRYSFNYYSEGSVTEHYAMIGMAYVMEDYPLFFDAMNECGLAVAGLKFQDSCYYAEPEKIKSYKDDNINEKADDSEEIRRYENIKDKVQVASYEFIMWILSDCGNVTEAEDKLKNAVIVGTAYKNVLKPQPMHWIISDRERSIVVEQTKDGLKIYNNPVGVLTNNPPFDYHLMNLNNYINITNEPLKTKMLDKYEMWQYSGGMGGIGLPGDLSSASRFVRATFVKCNSVVKDDTEKSAVNQFFHILDSVSMKRGMLIMDNGNYEITVYSSCCNLDDGIYYYTTYEDRTIRTAQLADIDIDGSSLCVPQL